MPRPVNKTITPESRFSKAPPGFSLAQSPGRWAWEKPPKYATAPEAVDALINNLEKADIQEEHVKLMAAGVSIEELVNVATKLGFMEGLFSVDVAELIKAPLAFYLMGLAADAQIPAKVFATKNGLPRKRNAMSDAQILNIMRDRNPEYEQYITQEVPKQVAARKEREAMLEDSFLTAEAEEIVGDIEE